MQKKLHIVCFDNPFPPSYGGVIDVFYKIKALHQTGVAITLHCFTTVAHKAAPELEAITERVHFYPKIRNPFYLLSRIPFATRSRSSNALAANLLADDSPILFEGLQSSYLAFDPRFAQRRKFLRLHNLESGYYKGTALSERNVLKKLLFTAESKKFRKLEQQLQCFEKVFTLSVAEHRHVSDKFGNAEYVPVLHGNEMVADLSGFGKFALYHGDLRLADNLRAAAFLVEVFRTIPDYELIIASGAGRLYVRKLIRDTPNIRYMMATEKYELDLLLRNAHINVMVSFQESGTKLKLVNSLFQSRHCLINSNIVDDDRIRELCVLATDVESFRQKIQLLIGRPYTDSGKRDLVLNEVLQDLRNAFSMHRTIFREPSLHSKAGVVPGI